MTDASAPAAPQPGPQPGPQPRRRADRRLFLALWPDARAAGRLTDLALALRRQGMLPGRPNDSDRLHVTLFHLGDFIADMPPDLVPATQAACASLAMPAFDIGFDRFLGTGRHGLLLPSRDPAALRLFHRHLGHALADHGVGWSERPFSPHVTLSYDPCDWPETAIDPIGWRVNAFHLVESLLGRHRHIRLGSWPLG